MLKLFVVALLATASMIEAQDLDLDSLITNVFNLTENKNTVSTTVRPIEPVPTQAPVVIPPSSSNTGGTGGTGGAAGETCDAECVPYYLCTDDGVINEDGAGIIDIRFNEDAICPNYLDKCCSERKPEVVTPPPTRPVVTPPPTPVKPTTPVEPGKPIQPTGPAFKFEGCGIRHPDGVGFRITGNNDNEAEYGEFPWMVAVLRVAEALGNSINVYECGGSLVSPSAVLIAAHCVHGKDTKNMFIRAGEWDTQTTFEQIPHQDRKIVKAIVHEGFKPATLANDVALLFLESPLELGETILPVCLPPQDDFFDGRQCFASGWGKNVFGKEGKYQVILKKVSLPVVPHAKCQDALRTTRLGKRFKLDKSFICAGGVAGKDTCRGDGGSPLVCPIQGSIGQYYQAGIVAWGIGCGENGIPGVYVNVAHFRNWIDGHLNQNNVNRNFYTY